MEHLSGLFVVAMVSLLGAISPGPDFAVVVRNNLLYSRKIGYFTSFGVSLGLLVHLAYTMVGIGVLIVENELLYNMVKYSGAFYLLYLGINGLISAFSSSSKINLNYSQEQKTILPLAAVKQGFLTNLLNPKSALFFVSLFSQLIDANTTTSLKIAYAFTNWFCVLGWFLFLSFMITGKLVSARLDSYRTYVDGIMGGFLMLLGIRMLF